MSEKVRSIRLVLWGWIMIEAKAARGQYDDRSVAGSEDETMERCEAKMWGVFI